MIVRVFIPKKLDPADGSDAGGVDLEFPSLPSAGHSFRMSDPTAPDFEIEKVGFIQEGDAVVAAVWLKRDADVNEWVRSLSG